ncbi:HAD domain-containing protein [Actinoplanes sp. NPDC026670]|uniref:HAD domain-containing protein n=1 Tax=Actinoplanes sp. NPDC026670 TaxID=3154700 RepID=UPI003400FE6C
MHQIPYLLLDIDGVLIPFPAEDKSTPNTHTRHQVSLTGFPNPIWVWLNHDHGPLIADAISTGLVRPVWCTSWRIDATRQIGPLLGLPHFEHIELPRLPITTSHPDGYLWKRDHVEWWLADAPAVWIDDDFTELDHRWAADRTARRAATLLVEPDPHAGLQPEHIQAALAWATDLASSRQAA